jgi:carbon monoxide dehydrogenase subunit G
VVIEGTVRTAGTADRVRDQLADVVGLQPLFPGCETIEAVGDREYRVVASARVGPVKPRLSGRMLVDRDADGGLRARIESQDALTGSHVRVAVNVNVHGVDGESSELRYSADVSLSGRLGQIGQGLIRETVAAMLGEFTRRLDARLQGRQVAGASTVSLGLKAAARAARAGIENIAATPARLRRDPQKEET